MANRSVRVALAAATVALSLATTLAACGDDDGVGDTGPAGTDAPAGTEAVAPADDVVIVIENLQFQVPDSVAPGATVTVENRDATSHTASQVDGLFDVDLGPNGTASFTAPDTAGTYPFVCNIHASMTGELVVG